MLGFVTDGYELKEFLDQVDVREDHTAAAVALEAYGIKGVARSACVLAQDL